MLEEDNEIFISFFNTSSPIPPTVINTIFERFYRLPEHRTTQQGTGLGLALVKQTLKRNAGDIKLIPQKAGNKFIVSLPIVKAHQTSTSLKSTPPLSIGHSKAFNTPLIEPTNLSNKALPSLLLVEDDLDMANLIKLHLFKHYKIDWVTTGQESLERAANLLPDIILLDYMLPDFNGDLVTKQIRENPLTCHIPILMLTARGDIATKVDNFKALVDGFMVKPFDETELIPRLDSLLRIRTLVSNSLYHKLSANKVTQHTTSVKEKFYLQISEVLEEHYQSADFGVPELAHELACSERQLQRKLKAAFNISPKAHIRKFRLKKAKFLIRNGERASDTAYQCGFNSPAYFTKCFKEEYGINPSDLTTS
jgi:DNA-binding response OmpR family regulator